MFEFLILTQIEETLEKADLQLHTELWYTESGTTTAAADGEINGGAAADCDASTVKGENGGESPPQQQHQHNPS